MPALDQMLPSFLHLKHRTISPSDPNRRTDEMSESLERLQVARKTMICVVQARDDRTKYVRIVRELDRHIAAHDDLSEHLARIMSEAA